MVLRQRESIMTEQPLKKKPKREDSAGDSDEPDFIQNLVENGVPTDLQALHLSMPAHVNEQDITLNAVNLEYSKCGSYRTSDGDQQKSVSEENQYITNGDNITIQPAPNIVPENSPVIEYANVINTDLEQVQDSSLDVFQQHLITQCLCGTPVDVLNRPFREINELAGALSTTLSEWPAKKIIQFLSSLQLLFGIYLKQNNKGFICSKIVDLCNPIIHNEDNLIEQIISLCETRNRFVHFLATRVLSSFLIIAKTNVNNEWLETITNYLTSESVDYMKMNFALEIIKNVVEWKDVEIHVLEDTESNDSSSLSTREPVNINCAALPFSDPESYDTSSIKGLIIKGLELKWPELVYKIQNLILHNGSVQTQTCILTFLALWESIISVKANLSVIDTKPFYAHLETFVGMLNANLPPIIWKQILSLFNEVLCYGSTLALQDLLPEDTCQLTHLIVRYVKDYRLLDSLPHRRDQGVTVNSFVGSTPATDRSHSTIDKSLLQKMILLVLKSVAITIKETRSDSSDSSVGSDDYDFYQDMQLIERSIRDVLKKVDAFIKNSLDFHPETPFSKVMVHLFSDQDDYMIESMVCTLDITVGISYRNAVFPDLLNMLNPTHSFIELLKIVSHDSDVLLDYLVSNETCFLLYLLRFLKYTRKNWAKFVNSCGEGSTSRSNELDDTMTVLIRLKMQINRLVARELFPYNISPVLRLLEVCENLYEGNEYS
ncbi:protein lines [Cylas formicarius]|uniref:protein lines n=1 Tax=Cylas formicarius TaxID=197179 RepID=UPI0029589610|nr:protein lines [Cylas formicarius]